MTLASGIAERFDFGHDLFLLRTPGYPLLLAGVFHLFGSHSATAIPAIQFAMVAGIAGVVAATFFQITRRCVPAVAAGLLATANLQLSGFAAMIMSEVPFALMLSLTVCCLVTYVSGGRVMHLLLGSFFVGAAYLFRPIGLALAAVCLLAAVLRWWQERVRFNSTLHAGDMPASLKAEQRIGFEMRRFAISCFAAVFPAAGIAGIWMIVIASRGDSPAATIGPALYKRAVTMDRLDSARSHELHEIRNVVDEARNNGWIAADADYRVGGTVFDAYRALGLGSYPFVCEKMALAAGELIREHRVRFVERTVRYALWSVLRPDSSFRYVPGGSPGRQSSSGEWTRAEDAELFDCSTYAPMMSPPLKPFEKYVALEAEPTLITPIWRRVVRSYHRTIESVIVFGSRRFAVYELFIVLCGLGVAFALVSRNRAMWMIPIAAILTQTLLAALLVGPVPRYTVPIQPWLHAFGLWPILLCAAPTKIEFGSAKCGASEVRRGRAN